jgi:hypothetical protein
MRTGKEESEDGIQAEFGGEIKIAVVCKINQGFAWTTHSRLSTL